MLKSTMAHINSTSPRAADWRAVFGGDSVPIKSPIPSMVQVPGEKGPELVMAYMLDINALTADQATRLVDHLSKRFNIPAAEVQASLPTEGCPILANDVGVSIDARRLL